MAISGERNLRAMAIGERSGLSVDEDAPLLSDFSVFSARPAVVDMVQFCLPIFVAHEDQGKIDLRIMRIGNRASRDQTLSFSYRTEEGSDGSKSVYEDVSGVIEMGPGETESIISVPIKQSGMWNATLEFKVILSDPIRCTLSAALSEARVKVLDCSSFPDESFQDDVGNNAESMLEVSDVKLYPAFVWYLFNQEGIPWRTVVMIVIDLLKNAYHYMTMVLTVYMVDGVFNYDKPASELLVPGSRLMTAYAVALLNLTPMVVFFLLDHMVVRLDVRGLLRISVTRNLFRNFMNFSRSSADQHAVVDMVISLTEDVSEVTFSYMKLIEMTRLLVEVGLSIFFTLQHNPKVWWVAVAVPAVMMVWGVGRTNVFLKVSEDLSDKEEACAYFINEVLMKLPLVSAYAQRPQMSDVFANKAEDLRQAKIRNRAVELTNMFLPKVMGPALAALYTAVGAHLVLTGQLKLGVFLATIKIFASICSAFYETFGLLMEVLGTFPALKEMFVLLNMPTDVAGLGQSNETRMRITEERIAEMPDHELVPKIDRLQIELVNVGFGYTRNGLQEKLQFENLNFKCEQGQLCLVEAAPGCGRQTLLQLLAHAQFPTAGTLFVPSHLRIVHVSRQIFLMNLSVWENLNFGNYGSHTEVHPYRVENILRRLDMVKVERMCRPEIDRLKDRSMEGETGLGAQDTGTTLKAVADLDALREAEQAEIHIARAFIMNPEVLLMHRPFCHFHRESEVAMLNSAMIDHRDNRGLNMPPETILQRRPRTIFFTVDSPTQRAIADCVWELPSPPDWICKQYANTGCNGTSALSASVVPTCLPMLSWKSKNKKKDMCAA